MKKMTVRKRLSGVSRKSGQRLALVAAMIVAGALPFAEATVARADEASERDLMARLKEVEKRLAEAERGGYFTASSDLEARVADLERTSADDKNAMAATFKGGMKTESADGATSYRWLGFVQNDFVWYWQNGNEDVRGAGLDSQNPEFGFRRVRLGTEGKYYGNVKWTVVMDFAGAAITFADVFAEITNCGIGKIRVGHFKEPWGMESLESDLYNRQIERGAVDRSFGLGRNTGIMVHDNFAEEFLYQVGVFRNANAGGNDFSNGEDGEYNITARLAGRPVIQDDGATWLHLGIAGSYRDFDGTDHKTADKQNIPLGMPIPFSTALGSVPIVSDDGYQIGLEAAWVSGPLTLRGEYARFSAGADNNTNNGADPRAGTSVSFDAWSLEAAYWLTGENTTYNKGSGTFGGTKPKKNYGDGDGMGAWELALRLDQADISDGDVAPGEQLDTVTLGVNWWLNPNTRIAFNYVSADYKELDETVNAFFIRVQYDF